MDGENKPSGAFETVETEPDEEVVEEDDEQDDDEPELSELEDFFSFDSAPESKKIAAVHVRRLKPEVINGVPAKGSLGRLPVEDEWTPDDIEDRLREKFGGGTYELRPLGEDNRRLSAGGKLVSKCVQVPGYPRPFAPSVNAEQGLGFYPSPAAPAPGLSPTPPPPQDRLDRIERLLESTLTLLNRPAAPAGFDGILQGVKVVKELQGLSGVASAAAAPPSRLNDLHDALELIARVREISDNPNDEEEDEENGEGDLVKTILGFVKDFAKNRTVEAVRTPEGAAIRSIPQAPAGLAGQAAAEEPGEQDEMEALLDGLLTAIKRGQSPDAFAADVKPKISRLTRLALKAINPADAADLIEEKFSLADDERALLQSQKGQTFLTELKKYL